MPNRTSLGLWVWIDFYTVMAVAAKFPAICHGAPILLVSAIVGHLDLERKGHQASNRRPGGGRLVCIGKPAGGAA
jgi:hypothetical protein